MSGDKTASRNNPEFVERLRTLWNEHTVSEDGSEIFTYRNVEPSDNTPTNKSIPGILGREHWRTARGGLITTAGIYGLVHQHIAAEELEGKSGNQ